MYLNMTIIRDKYCDVNTPSATLLIFKFLIFAVQNIAIVQSSGHL